MTNLEAQQSAILKAQKKLADAKPDEAILDLQTAVELDPQGYGSWLFLSKILYDQRRYTEAVRAVKAADQCDPLQADFRAVQSALQARRFGQAKAIATRMLDQIPNHAPALFALAQLAQARGDHELRAKLLEQGLEHAPANPILRMALFSALESAGALERAIETARHISEVQETFETISTLTGILFRYGQNEAALASCDRTEPFCAGDPLKLAEVNLIRAQIYRILGNRDKSIAMFRACLTANPNSGTAWWGLADMKTYKFSDADREAIYATIDDVQTAIEQKCMAAFALAKASEEQGDSARTMLLYRNANELRPNLRFKPDAFLTAIDRVTDALSGTSLEQQASPVLTGHKPIFILGLPRSGSTLIEQILASHSQIEGTLEQPILPNTKFKAHALCVQKYGGDYLSHLGQVSPADLRMLGQSYVDEGTLFRSGETPFFTDKLPFNFEHVGLIHKILPEAVIIDARRNPMDCGLSLFKQYFAQGSDFSYNLAHIGAYYNGYLKLMDHWHSVLPGKVLTVQHEHLVRDPKAKIQEILAHIGVPYEAGCLDFHQTKRAIRTASSEQVRQPINSRGIGAWRRVAAHLQPLKDSLGAATLARFEADLDLNP